MLDQMSAGRLEMAFGRGALRAELRFFDVDPAQSEQASQEIVVASCSRPSREGAVTVSEGGRKRRLALPIPPRCRSRIRRSGTASIRRKRPSGPRAWA